MDRVVVYRWAEVEGYLREQLANVSRKLARARGDDLLQLQGRAQQLEELLVLPDTLTALKEA